MEVLNGILPRDTLRADAELRDKFLCSGWSLVAMPARVNAFERAHVHIRKEVNSLLRKPHLRNFWRASFCRARVQRNRARRSL